LARINTTTELEEVYGALQTPEERTLFREMVKDAEEERLELALAPKPAAKLTPADSYRAAREAGATQQEAMNSSLRAVKTPEQQPPPPAIQQPDPPAPQPEQQQAPDPPAAPPPEPPAEPPAQQQQEPDPPAPPQETPPDPPAEPPAQQPPEAPQEAPGQQTAAPPQGGQGGFQDPEGSAQSIEELLSGLG